VITTDAGVPWWRAPSLARPYVSQIVESRSIVKGSAPGPAPAPQARSQQFPTDPVELADVAQRKLRRKSPSGGALGWKPRTPPFHQLGGSGVIDTVATRECGNDERGNLSPASQADRPRGREWLSTRPFDRGGGARVAAARRPGVGHPNDRRQCPCRGGRGCAMIDLVRCSLLGAMGDLNAIVQFRRAPDSSVSAPLRPRPSVDPG